ncbi:hypothetical protein CPLU01_13558 [Colletotrichum plurivorum]|uniref:Uncharacterized protein n=1 Tax=Colletotrichum plurivorum TaxID=2175906 RepID=A0A8H6JR83_9PEZI|nr:hypothetical protein CPLU01_13558 [Colletotrichum plurivorum]
MQKRLDPERERREQAIRDEIEADRQEARDWDQRVRHDLARAAELNERDRREREQRERDQRRQRGGGRR